MQAAITAIAEYLPDHRLTNEDLAAEFEGWTPEKIMAKTGIRERRLAGPDQCSSDLAVKAAERLFASGRCRPEEIDYILFVTETPDHLLPPTACLVQKRLGLGTVTGVVDLNQGCSGYVYGLGLARGLVETGQARCVLLLTADTYSKLLHPGDKSVRTLFGDAGAATIIRAVDHGGPLLGPFVYGSDGSGAPYLIVPAGGMRQRYRADAELITDKRGNTRTANNLFMDGGEVYRFVLRAVPQCVHQLASVARISLDQVDAFVFHQANVTMLEEVRRCLDLPAEKMVLAMELTGNTVSASIPLALKHAASSGMLRPGQLAMLVGFGVGYSWAGMLVRWTGI
jgi:3-oxoacyl-[acyl-carrier-protein] synthase-3